MGSRAPVVALVVGLAVVGIVLGLNIAVLAVLLRTAANEEDHEELERRVSELERASGTAPGGAT